MILNTLHTKHQMKKICFATNNPNKLKEIREALPNIQIVGLKEIGCNEELPETTNTLKGNSLQKAQYIYDNYNVDCFADDTGLEVEALNGEPGVYSARYAGETCNSGDNMSKLLTELTKHTNRKAQFRTIITLIESGKPQTFEGIAKGVIRTQKSGVDGFGYDPVFEPLGYGITFAEMSMTEKNKISHRGIAVRKMLSYFK